MRGAKFAGIQQCSSRSHSDAQTLIEDAIWYEILKSVKRK